MKRIIYVLVLVGTIFVGCNPIEDINNDIDAIEDPILGEASYTLTDEDYETLELGFGSFSSLDDAKDVLPAFISDMYPLWGNGSSVLMGFDLYIGNAEGVSDYSGADVYQLTNADYASTGSDAFGFYPNVDSDDHIPGVLDAAIAAPEEGDIVLAKYKQYFDDPVVGLADLYFASFPTNYGDMEVVSVTGADNLGWTEQASNAQGSGWDGGAMESEEWLISPEIDLSGESELKLQVTQEIDFLGDPDLISILVSTDYTTGTDPMMATWDVFDFDKTVFGDMTASEDYDFSAYDGESIHIAFFYSSTDADSPRWRVESFAVKTVGVTGDTNSKGTHYAYDGGEWEAVDGVYFVSSADFDSMGEGSGQPGQYNNFSSSVRPENYLPTFLSITEPFAYGQEEDELIVVYDYFSSSSGAQVRGNRYTVIDGMWVGHESTISTTLQFGHDGTTWVPDNTIRYTLSGGDVDFISNAFLAIYPGPADNVGFFGSFDRRPSSDNYWSDEMLLEAFNALLESGGFVTAEEQKYVLTYVIYNGSTTDESMSVIKSGGEWVYQE